MAGTSNPNQKDFSIYDSMEDEQLRQILRADALNHTDSDSDFEALYYIMQLLSQRRIARGEGRDIQKAYEAFLRSVENME